MNARSATTRLLVASAVIAVLLLGVAGVVFVSTGVMQRDANFIRADAVPGSIDAHLVRNAVSKDFRESLLAVVAITPESGREHLRIAGEQQQIITAALEHYRGTIFIDPVTDRRNVADFKVARAAYVEKRDQLLTLSRDGRREAALEYADNVLTPAYQQLATACDTLVAYNDHNADILSAHIIRETARVRTTVIVTVFVATLGSLLLAFNLLARRREEKENALQAARFAKALRMAQIALWVRDFKKGTVEWSDTFDDLVGHAPGGFSRTIEGWLAAVHPEDSPKVRDAIEASRRNNTRFEVEYRLRKLDGSYIWIRDSGNVFLQGGQDGVAYGAIRDITDRKQAEENTQRLEAQLRQSQKLEAIGTLAGGIAHDFNNLLTGIIGNAELTTMEIDANGDANGCREMLDTIRRAGHRASALVRQILTFSRQAEKTMEPVVLEPMVSEVMMLMRSTVPANIGIVSSLEPNLPVIVADATQIHQVLVNLCTNSVHAMKGINGRLTVTLESLEVDEEFIMLHPDLQPGLHVRLSVTDTGHGIHADTLKRIFEPFFTTKAPGEGTGLGLSVVHGIVKEHNGGIYCYSHPGEGTAFHVYFPAVASTFDEPRAAPKEATPRAKGECILVVDDEADVQRTAATMLRRLGYVVQLAYDGASAVDVFRANPDAFDLVLTDLAMPGGTGLELAGSLIRVRADVAIVLMTGFAGNLTSASVQKLGIRELVMKPLTVDRLGRAVRRVLDESVLAKADSE